MPRSEVNCSKCDTQVGWHHEYYWGPNGQDPPEDEIFPRHEGCEDKDGNYLCVSCWNELEFDEEEDFNEEETFGQ
jgi:hypothetical protein